VGLAVSGVELAMRGVGLAMRGLGLAVSGIGFAMPGVGEAGFQERTDMVVVEPVEGESVRAADRDDMMRS
jgi:hypothetical protein